jgi:hypothetical protein
MSRVVGTSEAERRMSGKSSAGGGRESGETPPALDTTVIGGDWRMCALCHECDHCMVIGSVVSGIWARSPVHAVGNRRGPLTGGPGPVK